MVRLTYNRGFRIREANDVAVSRIKLVNRSRSGYGYAEEVVA